MRRRWKIAWWTFGILAAVLGGSVVLIESSWTEERLKESLTSNLAHWAGGTVRVEVLHLKPFAGSIRLEGLSLEEGRGVLADFRIEEVEIGVSLTSLLTGTVRPVFADINGFRAALRGEAEWSASSDAAAFDPEVLDGLRDVKIKDGVLHYNDREIHFDLEARGIEFAGDRTGGILKGQTAAKTIHFTADNILPQTLEDVWAVWTWRSPRLAVEEIRLRTAGGEGTGTLAFGLTPKGAVLRGGFNGTAHLETVIDPSVIEVSGPVRTRGAVRWSAPGSWKVRGDWVATGPVRVLGLHFDEIQGKYEAASGHYDLIQVKGLTRGGSRLDNLETHWVRPTLDITAQGDADLEEALQRLGLAPGRAQGRATFQVKAHRPVPGEPFEYQTEGDLTASGGLMEGVSGAFTARGDKTNGTADFLGLWKGAPLTVHSAWEGIVPDGFWNLSVDLERVSGEAALELGKRYAAQAQGTEFAFESSLLPEPREGLDLHLQLDGRNEEIGNVSLLGSWRRPVWEGTAFATLEAQIHLPAGGGLEGSLDLDDGLGEGLQATLRGDPQHTMFLEARSRNLPLSLLHHWASRTSLTDQLSGVRGTVTGEVKGTLGSHQQNLRVILDAEANAGDWPPAALHFSGTVTNREIQVDTGQLKGKEWEASFSGRWPLPGFEAAVRAEGPLRVKADLAALLPHWKREGKGSLRFEGAVDGWNPGHLPGLRGTLTWSELILEGISLPDGQGAFQSHPEGFLFTAHSGPVQLETLFQGHPEDPGFLLKASWKQWDISRMGGMAGELAPAMSGWSDGELVLEGPLARVAAWKGRADLTHLELLGPTFGARLEAPTRLDLQGNGKWLFAPSAPMVVQGEAGGRMNLSGGFSAWGPDAGTLDLLFEGSADLNALEVIDPDLVASGTVTGRFLVRGTFSHPEVSGFARLSNGRVRDLTLPEAADELEGEFFASHGTLTVNRLSGRFGGGFLQAKGQIQFDGWVPDQFHLDLSGRNVAMSRPRGMTGRYDADVSLGGSFKEPEIRGTVTMLAGLWTRPLSLTSMPWQRARTIEPTGAIAGWWSRLALKVKVLADGSLSVRNDLARLELSLGLDISGTWNQPLLAGTAVVLEGGKMTFRDLEYEIQSGQIVFDDPRGRPTRLRMVADTEINPYRIRLDLDASTEKVDFQLSSSPALSQTDILALLLTGQTVTDSSTGSSNVASEDAAAVFGSELGELILSGPARRFFGLTRFQLSPVRAGSDARPTARITVGRRVDEKTTVIYSRDLSGEGRDLYWIERELGRSTRFSLGREELGGTSVGLRWLFRFGDQESQKVAGHEEPPRLEGVVIEGVPKGVHVRRKSDLGLSHGASMTPSLVANAAEGLRRVLIEEGYLDSQVTPSVTVALPSKTPARGTLKLDVDAGPRWTLQIEAPAGVASVVRDALADLWSTTSFARGQAREISLVLRERLADEGYATATVDVFEEPPPISELRVVVDPGELARVQDVDIRGAQELSEPEILNQVLTRPAGVLGTGRPLYRPRKVEEDAEAIVALYASRGFLEARVTPQVGMREEGREIHLVFVIEEGPRTMIGTVRVEGDWPADLGSASEKLGLRGGEPYMPQKIRAAEDALRETLDKAGYYEAEVTTRQEPIQGKVNLAFRVQPGRAARVAQIQFEGLGRTRRKIVERSLQVHTGRPLTKSGMQDTERELFKLGLFRKVEIIPQPSPDDPGQKILLIKLEEAPEIALQTGLAYDSEQQVRANATLSHDNLWGLGRTGSLQAYASALRRGVRATLEDRHLAKNRLEGLITTGIQREKRDGFTVETVGSALQIGSPLRQDSRWQLRYSLEDNRFHDVTIDPGVLEGFEISDGRRVSDVRLGSITGSLVRDRRDDPFLPQRGWIGRGEVGIWATPLASEENFISATGQWGGYQPLGWVTLAGSVRASMAWPFSGTGAVPLSQRFFVGGIESLRGFERDKVGPLDKEGGQALGGESLLLINLESRFRIFEPLDLVLFHDAGNVWLTPSDMFSTSLRRSAGLGLRWRTPVGALRIEYGRVLDPRPGEPTGEVFFTIGEPF